jgi:hypothetical protein
MYYFDSHILSRLTLYWWDKETQDLEEALGEALDVKSLDPMPVGIFAIAFKSRWLFSCFKFVLLIGGFIPEIKGYEG